MGETMLTEQNTINETSWMDSVPMGFITTDDGRTLLAVADHEDGILEFMTAPIAFVQQNNVLTPTFIKSVDGNLVLQQPVFQISIEGVTGPNVQQTIVLPQQTVETTTIIQNNTNISCSKKSSEDPEANILSSTKSQIQSTKNIQSKTITKSSSSVKKIVNKRSCGRPKKGTILQNPESLKCDICGQSFNKQFLYRKHMHNHAEEKPHRCPKCSASFNIPINFTLHMATHNTGEPKCPECGRKYSRMASLKSHMLQHVKEENLFCTECEDAFSTKAQLDAHLKLHSEKWSTEDVRKCKLCNKQFVQPAMYRQHIREHYKLQTKVVMQTTRGTKQKTMYKCKICLKSFQKQSQLTRHIRVHTGEKPFKCTICGRAFTQKGSLQIHIWHHKGIRPHSCPRCNAKFSQKGNLNAHILRVHNIPEGQQIYSCSFCTCVFTKMGSLNGHVKRVHSKEMEEPPPKCDSSTEAEIRATVNNVILQLASLPNGTNDPVDSTNSGTINVPKDDDILQQALKNSGLPSKDKIPEESSEPKKPEHQTAYVTLLDKNPDGTLRKYQTIRQRSVGRIRWYACTFCHKEFKKPSDLIRHMRVHTHEKPFKCSFCARTFALKSTMLAHERTHTGTKKYACESCNRTFACSSSLTAHMRLHTKPHKCTTCDKSFSSNSVLKSHMKTHEREKEKLLPETKEIVPQIVLQEPLVISDAGNKISVAHVQPKQQAYEETGGARPHKCWVCPAAFRKISHLKQHYRRHTGERPYKCPKCDRRFTSNSVLKSHLHTHEDAKPYSCSVCDQKFSTQSSMKRHLITHSNKRPFMCPYCHKTFKTSVTCKKHMKSHVHELAQEQLEQQKMQKFDTQKTLDDVNTPLTSIHDTPLTLSDDIDFQPQMAPDFTQAFSDQFQNIEAGKEKTFLTTNVPTGSIANQDIPDIGTNNLGQTLHADETGTITLPNYTPDQNFTQESMRELEETLNRQLYHIGVNLGLGSNLSKQLDDHNDNTLENREQPVLNIIYENGKNLENPTNAIFTSQFDSFDMSQITLPSDNEIDINISSANSTSMASILPRSVKEEFITASTRGNVQDDQSKKNKDTVLLNSKQNCTEISRPVQFCQKYPKVIAKADTTDISDTQETLHRNIQQNTITMSCGNEKATLTFNEDFESSIQLKTHTEASPLHTGIERCDLNERIIECDSLLQCHMCGKQGFTTSGLKEHLKIHRGAKEYQCSECSQRFCSNGGLSRHMKIHTNKLQWKCLICNKMFTSKSQLKLHNKEHDSHWKTSVEPDSSQRDPNSLDPNLASITELGLNIDPSISEKVLLATVAEKDITKQIENTDSKVKKEYENKCEYCPKTFRKPSDLKRHIRTHTGERPYSCEFCEKSFAVKCTLDSHVKVHTGAKTFCCHVCNSLFSSKGSLKVHMRLHTGSKPFTCPICNARFRTSGHRKVHLSKHVKNSTKRKSKQSKVAELSDVTEELEKTVETATVQSTISENEIMQNVEYPNLDTITIDASSLTNQITFGADGTILNNNSVLSLNESNQIVANLHFLFANELVTIQPDDNLLPQVQSTETSIIHDETQVNELIAPNTLPINCNELNGNHIVITNLSDNSNVVDQTTMQLDTCMAVMQMDSTESSLPVKVEQQSTKKQTAKNSQAKKECDVCGKTFPKPYQVERHKRIHTGERPYKCDRCPKSFAQRSTLQLHEKYHTGDRPYPCPHCKYTFTQKGNLQTHLKRVHQLDCEKKIKRSQPILTTKLETVDEAKLPNLDEISFVELLK